MENQEELIDSTLASWLLSQIEKFMDINGMNVNGSDFGWVAAKDASLVGRLRDGGDLTTRKMELLLAFLEHPIRYDGKSLPYLKPIDIQRRSLP